MQNESLSAHDLMLASLDAVAQADVDIVPVYFERFFGSFPAEEKNFYNKDSSRGLMVNDMLSMLLGQAEGADWMPMMMRTQVITHRDHGDIALERYRDALDLLVTVLADVAGDRWCAAYEQAWRGETAKMFALIERAY